MNEILIAKSKLNGDIFYDITNKSGCLTKHIKEQLKIPIPSLWKRKTFYKKNGIQWYEQWFDFQYIPSIEYKKCPFCGWKTTDIYNKSGCFIKHLQNEHNVNRAEYLKSNPQEKYFLSYSCPTKQIQLEDDKNNYICCKICGKKLQKINGSHLKKHNISKKEYIEKFGDIHTASKRFHDKLSKHMKIQNQTMSFHHRSKAEIEIENFIKDIGVQVNNKRTIINGSEIDIYSSKYKIGIEYDGIYYHTEQFGKDKNYHLNKTLKCEEQGIRLIHIFEDEWLYKQNAVKSFLSDVFHKKNKNKLIIKEIDNKNEDLLNLIKKYSLYDDNLVFDKSICGFFENKIVSYLLIIIGDDSEYTIIDFASDEQNSVTYSLNKFFLYIKENINNITK